MTMNGKTETAAQFSTPYRLHRPKLTPRRGQLRHQLVIFSDVETAPRKDWVVDGLLGAGDFSCVYGSPGAGKSIWVGDLAAHVGSGALWFGRRVTRGAVLYVAAERGKVVERRLAAIRKHHGWDDLPLGVISGGFDLRTNRVDADEIILHAAALEERTDWNVVLIVVDTYNRVLCGGDENSSRDAGAVVANLAYVQQATGAHMLLTHHTPHEVKRLRGHGLLLAALDTSINVQELPSSRMAILEKSNDAIEGAKMFFNLQSVVLHRDEDTGRETTAPVVAPLDKPANETRSVAVVDRLTKNQRTMFGILHAAGAAGLDTEQWNERARKEGIGVRRRADLCDIRETLKAKNIVRCYSDRWTASQ